MQCGEETEFTARPVYSHQNLKEMNSEYYIKKETDCKYYNLL